MTKKTVDLSIVPLRPDYYIYELQTTLLGREVKLFVSARATTNLAVLNPRTNDLLEWVTQHWDNIRAYSARQLLATKNDSWLKEGEPRATTETFVEALQPLVVRVGDYGEIVITLDVGTLFWGHSIVVEIDEGQLEAAYLEG
jgi:hypothetical protein